MAGQKGTHGGDRMAWWRDAKFGMFIHWGLYAVPAGIWKGKPVEGIGEWIATYAQIPPDEYAQLAGRFTARKFDADEWARTAKAAGMKYMVLTAKHADGFAMYRSRVSDYNIVDATPFGRDAVAELAKACRKQGLRFGIYYSQDQDLHEPDAGGYSLKDAMAASPAGFERYTARKVRPQMKELLTQYGPLDLVWFDNPLNTTPETAEGLKRLVRQLQPKAIINGRIGFGLGDYKCLGDNQTSAGGVTGDWETCATMNNTWGYKKTDHEWKSVREMLRTLVDITSKGGTYLLNVGPTGEGVIPGASVTRLRAIGKWLETNGEAIYGAAPSPFPYDFPWGRVTAKGGTLYLHFFEWPRGEFRLHGLKSRVKSVRVLGDRRARPEFSAGRDKETGAYVLDIELPRRAPDREVSVVAVEMAGGVAVDATLQQQADGTITLPAHAAKMHLAEYWGKMRIGQGGGICDWYSPDNRLSWRFRVFAPGKFEVLLVTRAVSLYGWLGGHRVEVTTEERKMTKTLKATAAQSDGSPHFPSYTNRIGTVEIGKAGVHPLELRALKINQKARGGLTVRRCCLCRRGRRQSWRPPPRPRVPGQDAQGRARVRVGSDGSRCLGGSPLAERRESQGFERKRDDAGRG